MLAVLGSAFVALFVVLDPPGLAPLFIGLTRGMDAAAKRTVALEASVIAFGVLAGAALFGQTLLTALGINIASFRIAGGLLLFAIAFEMVFERRQERKAADAAAPRAGGRRRCRGRARWRQPASRGTRLRGWAASCRTTAVSGTATT